MKDDRKHTVGAIDDLSKVLAAMAKMVRKKINPAEYRIRLHPNHVDVDFAPGVAVSSRERPIGITVRCVGGPARRRSVCRLLHHMITHCMPGISCGDDRETPYGDLPLSPSAIADAVCRERYRAQESPQTASVDIKRIEAARARMTAADRETFIDAVDRRCREAFRIKAKWFMKCLGAEGNAGRDQLYVWIRHWMASYLTNKEAFLKRTTLECGTP